MSFERREAARRTQPREDGSVSQKGSFLRQTRDLSFCFKIAMVESQTRHRVQLANA